MATFNASQNGNWSDPATWGGAGVPGVGDAVVIDNFTVDLDQDVEIGQDAANFTAIELKNSAVLRYPTDANRALTFAGRFLGATNSLLQMGTADNPIGENYTATLNLKRESSANNTLLICPFSMYGSRGQQRFYSLLASQAASGQDQIALADDIDFVAGDEFYIMATEGADEGELLTVQSYDSATKTITTTTNLSNTHNPNECYIILLSRNVVINKKVSTYGGHIFTQGWNNSLKMQWVKVKGYSDAAGANMFGHPSYYFYGWTDYARTGWALCDKIVFDDTNTPAGDTGCPHTNQVFFYLPSLSVSASKTIGLGTINQQIASGYKLGAIFVIGYKATITIVSNTVCDLLVVAEQRYTSGYSPCEITNDGIIKKLVVSAQMNTYGPILIGTNGKVLETYLGYPVIQPNCINRHNSSTNGIVTFFNVTANYSSLFIKSTSGLSPILYIFKNITKNGVPAADEVYSDYVAVSLDSSVKKDGESSFKFLVTTAGNYKRVHALSVPMIAGKLLTVSGFWRHNGLFENDIAVKLIASGIDSSATIPATANEWHPFVLSGVAEFDGFADLFFSWQDDTVNAAWWVDNITINASRIDLGGMEFFGSNIFPPVILKTELDAADILRQSITSYNDSGTVGEAFNELALLRKLSKNDRKVNIETGVLIIYDDDKVTPFLNIQLKNAQGENSHKNVTEWREV